MKSNPDINRNQWKDKWFLDYSAKSKLLWLYVRTAPFGNDIGIFYCPRQQIMADTGLTEAQLKVAFEEVKEQIAYDDSYELVFHKDNVNLQYTTFTAQYVTGFVKRLNDYPHSHPFIAEWVDRHGFLFDYKKMNYKGESALENLQNKANTLLERIEAVGGKTKVKKTAGRFFEGKRLSVTWGVHKKLLGMFDYANDDNLLAAYERADKVLDKKEQSCDNALQYMRSWISKDKDMRKEPVKKDSGQPSWKRTPAF